MKTKEEMDSIYETMEEYGKQQWNKAIDAVLWMYDNFVKVTREDIEGLKLKK